MRATVKKRPGRALVYLGLALIFALLTLAGQATMGVWVFLTMAVFFELLFWIELLRALRRDPVHEERG